MAPIDSLQARLEAGEVAIMDGGTGSEIRFRGVNVAGKSWTGEPMLTHSGTVREIHEDYIKAGAEIIITNRHSPDRTTFPGYSSRGDAANYNSRIPRASNAS